MSSAPAFYQSLSESRQLLLTRDEVRWKRQADAARSDAMSANESSVPAILGLIPGVRIAGPVQNPPQGAPCLLPATGDGSVGTMPSGGRRDLRDALAEQAAARLFPSHPVRATGQEPR